MDFAFQIALDQELKEGIHDSLILRNLGSRPKKLGSPLPYSIDFDDSVVALVEKSFQQS